VIEGDEKFSYSHWHGFQVLAVCLDLLSRCHTWMMASISLVMVVPPNFCNRGFVIDYRFSTELRSGEFSVQSKLQHF